MLFRMIEDEILPLCQAEGLGVLAYNPLAGGMLTDRYTAGQALEAGSRFTLKYSGEVYQRRYWREEVFDVVERLREFMRERGKRLQQVALAWTLRQPGITSAIVGASKLEQLQDTLGGVDLTLDDEEMAACDDVWYQLPRQRDREVALR